MLNLTIPATLNYSRSEQITKSRADKRKKAMSAVSLTFRDLSNKMDQLAIEQAISHASLANLQSALKAFLTANKLSEDAVVGSTLRACYYRNLSAHVEQLTSEKRSPQYIANRKSLLGKWASLVNQIDVQDAVANNTYTPFQLALKDIVARGNITPTELANVLKITKSTFRGWLRGVQPRQAAVPQLRRIESFFAMEPDSLVALAFERNFYKATEEVTSEKIPFRKRLSEATKDPYQLKTLTPQLAQEWHGLLEHKTEKLPILKRYSRGAWVTTEYFTKGSVESNQHLFIRGKFVPTANIVWTAISSYLGWLSRSQDREGAGINADQVQTLAWMTHKSMAHKYLKWKIERSDDKVHNGILDFLNQVKALSHPVHGYLTQMPSLNQHLPEYARHENWKEACQEAFKWANEMKRNLTAGGIENSREPMLPIKHILEHPEPLEAIGDMCARMRASKPATGGVEEAIWARDLLLIRLMASNPLRSKNLKLLTYKPDNSGNLYKKSDGSWNIRIDKKAFKNQKGAAGEEEYDVPVTANIWPSIEQYLHVFRPMLPDADKVSFVFLSSLTEKPKGYIGPWLSLNRRVFYLTKRYLWGCPGIGAHGIRYIIGTSILKKNPDAWGLAAAALHDKEETVRKHYAHLRTRDKVAHAHASLASAYERI